MKYLIAILLLISCNPVKKVIGDKEKFDEVAKEVIRRGYCVNDTVVVEKIKDSIVYKDSVIERIKNIPCKDFDTTIRRATISVRSGVLTYSAKDSLVYRVRIITNNIRDKSRENILSRDIANRDSIITARDMSVRGLQTVNKDLKSQIRWMKLKMIGLVVIALVIVFRKQIIRIAGGII